MTVLRTAALLLLLAATDAMHAAKGVPWHSSTETAAAVARGQKKLLLVYYRGSCGGCPIDVMFEQAADDDVFMHALDAFIPLRLNAVVHPIGDELALYGKPVIAFYDASGMQLAVLNDGLPWSDIVEEMLRFRSERPAIVRSTELRFAGRIAEADIVLGNALLNTSAIRNAIVRLERAMRAFSAAGQEDLAQSAQVLLGSAWYVSGKKTQGRGMINDVLRAPANDVVAAQAHLEIAKQHEAAAVRAKVTLPPGAAASRVTAGRDMRDRARAVEEYRKAYDLAPAGSVVLDQATHALMRIDDRPLPPKGRIDASLRIVPPSRQTIVGDADFFVESRAGVARIDFYLDNAKVGSVTKQPFRQSIDVGGIPRVRTVKAIAFDGAGKALSEASITINDRVDAFIVTVVAPAAAWIGGEQNVELDVRVPPGRSLEHVDLSWNGKQIATLTTAPFRTRMSVTEGEFGYLRAVAVLDDGTVTEATKVYNALGVSESMEVGAVTVIASVTDRNGERVGGLQSEDFRIDDEKKRVQPTLRSTDDDPVTIGVAVDSSSSMRGRQLYIIRAATQFLERALRPQDQAFVVAFDTGPRLVHARSSDSKSLRESVFALTPSGGTSIFDGVTFALQQFQGIPGKKALIVFTDGLEGTSSASAGECERLARTVGVPVYVVVPPGDDRNPNALAGIARDTGGTMFLEEPEESFPALFEKLAAEMRGQYVLSFTRPAGIRAGTWRSLRVAVERRDANVRAIQGYRAN